MAYFDELAARRFDKSVEAKDISLVAALEAAKKAVSETEYDHVIILLGKSFPDDASSHARFFQAGTYAAHAQEGLIVAGQRMISQSGKL